jgi:hypothetical protein
MSSIPEVTPRPVRVGVSRPDRARRERGLASILDVVASHEAARALYESAGWQRLGGRIDVALPDGTIIQEFVYAAPH